MSTNKIGLAAVILVAVAVGIFWHQQSVMPLRDELGELRPQVARLTAETKRLEGVSAEFARVADEQRAELVRLREEVASLKSAAAQAPSAANTVQPVVEKGADPAQSRLVSITRLQNVGNSTPHAVGQTLGWALQNGEVDLIASLVTFEPAARAKMERLIAALPESFREKYGTPERLLALAAAGGSSLTAAELLSEEEAGPDDFNQRLRMVYKNGDTRVDDLHFHHDADGWKQVITMQSADRIEAAMRARAEGRSAAKAAGR